MSKTKNAKIVSILMLIATFIFMSWSEISTASELEKKTDTCEIISIRTVKDLEQIRTNPKGHYRLEEDIDLQGVLWEPVDFYGSFDGQNHVILNTKVSSTSKETRTTYDGNFKSYDTGFAGFFGVLEGATVKDVQFINTNISLDLEGDVFFGGIAGYSDNSEISGCTITGNLEMRVTGKMWGGAGAIGYGNGKFHNNTIDVTLQLYDKDEKNRDESFLGGVLGAGYLDIDDNNIKIDSYLCDAGYVHSGGIVGMYILYPRGIQYQGSLTNNLVDGKITFFENNTDRRAYCDGEIGEIMNWSFNRGNNDVSKFKRDERFDYSVELKPHECSEEKSKFEKTDVPATAESYGYTVVKCLNCGYETKEDFKLYVKAMEIAEPKEETPVSDTDKVAQAENEKEQTQDNNDKLSNEATNPVLYYVISGILILGAIAAGMVVLFNKK